MKNNRKKGMAAVLLVLLLGISAGLAGCGTSAGGDSTSGKSAGGDSASADKAPTTASDQVGSGDTTSNDVVLDQFKTQDLDGNTVTNTDVFGKNKLNLVNVWATWCPPCRQEIPDLQKLQDKYKDQGLAVIGLLSDGVDASKLKPDAPLPLLPDNIDTAKKIMKDSKASYLMILPDMALTDNVMSGITAFPTTFFTDKNGKVIGPVLTGLQSEKTWDDTIQSLLKDVSADQTDSTTGSATGDTGDTSK